MSNFFSFTILIALLSTQVIFFLIECRLPDFFFLPFLLVAGIFIAVRKVRNNIFLSYHGDFDHYEEKINLLRESIAEQQKLIGDLPLKHKRMSFLFRTSQGLIELSDEGEILDRLLVFLADLFIPADFILIYLFDRGNDTLSLARSRKAHGETVYEKQGDLLDAWVLRHNQTLVIDDITQDFRFECQGVKAWTERGMRSFLITPLAIEHRVQAVARVEAEAARSFSLEDSRLMRNVCDLGAVVLERAHLFKQAQELAISDPLTSLFVKDYFYKELKRHIKTARSSGKELGIVMVDVDDFKTINDRHGHIVGDAVLKKISRTLIRSAGGAGNIVSRFGGEEFILLLTQATAEQARESAEKLCRDIAASGFLYRRKNIMFTISCGVSSFPLDGEDATELVRCADDRMYTAKSKGKNRVCFSG